MKNSGVIHYTALYGMSQLLVAHVTENRMCRLKEHVLMASLL